MCIHGVSRAVKPADQVIARLVPTNGSETFAINANFNVPNAHTGSFFP